MTELLDVWTGAKVAQELIPLIVAAILGFVVSLAYVLLGQGQRRSPRMAGALVILTVIMCLIVRVVDDLASAFIVVGALTLLRLRAAIEDTQAFSFLLLAVAVGMGVGEGEYLTATLGALFASLLALLIFGRGEDASTEGVAERRFRLSVPVEGLEAVRQLTTELCDDGRPVEIRQRDDGRCEVRGQFDGDVDWSSATARLMAIPGLRDIEIRASSGRGAA